MLLSQIAIDTLRVKCGSKIMGRTFTIAQMTLKSLQ